MAGSQTLREYICDNGDPYLIRVNKRRASFRYNSDVGLHSGSVVLDVPTTSKLLLPKGIVPRKAIVHAYTKGINPQYRSRLSIIIGRHDFWKNMVSGRYNLVDVSPSFQTDGSYYWVAHRIIGETRSCEFRYDDYASL